MTTAIRTYNGPRFGRDANMVERNGESVTLSACICPTCKDMGAWLSEPHHVITFDNGDSRGHVPARWIK